MVVVLAGCTVLPDSVSLTTTATPEDNLTGPLLSQFVGAEQEGYGLAVTATYRVGPRPLRFLRPVPYSNPWQVDTLDQPWPDVVEVDPWVAAENDQPADAIAGEPWWIWLVLAVLVASGAAMVKKWLRET